VTAGGGATVPGTNDGGSLWTGHGVCGIHLHVALASVFAYEVDAGDAGAFEAVYGPDGEWARYFRGADGYRGTELLRAPGRDGVSYLVIDRWDSAPAYERFLSEHEEEYGRRNRAAVRLYRKETVIGRFEVL
jgi:heme-degrading monooxygenase HmoA